MITKKRIREFLLLSTATAFLGVGAPAIEALELDETELFFELNDTNGDLGIHASIDGGPYTNLEIEAERRREEFEAEVELSHVMAAPASNITINGVPAAEDCDADPLPSVSEPVIIAWDPVTESHPEIGEAGSVEDGILQTTVVRDLDIHLGHE